MQRLLGTLMLALAFAAPAMATTPAPMLWLELEWRGPETLLVIVRNQFADIRFDAELSVTAGIGPRLVCEEPIAVVPGKVERAIRVPLLSEVEEIGVRVTGTDDRGLMLVQRIKVTRERALTHEEIEEHQAAERAVMQARAAAEHRERMRVHVRRIIARGGKPTCSDESPAEWNEAVVAELGDAAPSTCQRTSNR